MPLITFEPVGVTQIKPHRNKWAWDLFIKGCANHWMPTEIGMAKDIEQWNAKGVLTEDEKLVVKRCMGFFAGSESLVANNLLLDVFRWVTDPECRQYLYRQSFEEALHNLTVVYVCESLNLDIKEVYEAYRNIPAIKAKDDFLIGITKDTSSKGFKLRPFYSCPKSKNYDGKDAYDGYLDDLASWTKDNEENIWHYQDVLRNLITYYILCEGMFFYSAFAMLLSFGRQNKLPGIAEQIQYTLRDEALHVEFGTQVINQTKQEFPQVWTKQFQEETVEHVKKTASLELAFANDILPRGVLGLNAGMFLEYVRFLANLRLSSLGLPEVFPQTKNPFPWLSEIIELPKLKNFFERRVTEYGRANVIDDF